MEGRNTEYMSEAEDSNSMGSRREELMRVDSSNYSRTLELSLNNEASIPEDVEAKFLGISLDQHTYEKTRRPSCRVNSQGILDPTLFPPYSRHEAGSSSHAMENLKLNEETDQFYEDDDTEDFFPEAYDQLQYEDATELTLYHHPIQAPQNNENFNGWGHIENHTGWGEEGNNSEEEEEEEEENFTANTADELINMIRYIGDDFEGILYCIRNARFQYTPVQTERIDEIEREYLAMDINIQARDTAALRERTERFIDALGNPEDEETYAVTRYFSSQKGHYERVYDALISTSFPYSEEEIEELECISLMLPRTTGDPRRQEDQRMMSLYENFFARLEEDPMETIRSRLIITSTLDYHMKMVIEGLRMTAWWESLTECPINTNFEIKLATYVIGKIEEIFDTNVELGSEEGFHRGIRDIYDTLASIFRMSRLQLTEEQDHLLSIISEGALHFNGNP